MIKKPTPWLPYRWVSPGWGPPYDVVQVLWDAFHQCLRLSYDGRSDLFKDVLGNHFHYQREDGWLPVAIHGTAAFFAPGPEGAGQPFLAQGVLAYAAASGDTTWPAEVYGKLERYLGYWEAERQAGRNLYCWWFESGFDNDPAVTFHRPRSIISASASALLWMEYRAMSRLAALLGRKQDAVRYEKKSGAIRDAVNRTLWDEKHGCYTNVDVRTGRFLVGLGLEGLPGAIGAYSFLSWHSALALYSGLAPKERAQRHIEEYLLRPEHFWSSYGIRSLSARSEYYNNAVWGNPARYSSETNMTASNWQGPVWFPVNYFVFHALIRYGYVEQAEELADKIIRLLAAGIRRNGYMNENYDAETGRPLYAPKFASWNMLADVMHRELETRTSPLLNALLEKKTP
ncbi:MAG: trehalase family glycosidase [Candidatus Omnitrophota bacterium]